MPRVGFSLRLWAYVLDWFLSALLGLGASLFFGAALGAALGAGFGGTVGAAAGGALGANPEAALGGLTAGALLGGMFGAVLGVGLLFLLSVAAYGLIEGFTGRSPGKMLLGLAIRNQDGRPARPKALWLRYALKHSAALAALLGASTGFLFLSALANALYFGFLLGCLAALNYNHQALHDILAGTAVYRRADILLAHSPLDTGPQMP